MMRAVLLALRTTALALGIPSGANAGAMMKVGVITTD
jgi:hypothetical protein